MVRKVGIRRERVEALARTGHPRGRLDREAGRGRVDGHGHQAVGAQERVEGFTLGGCISDEDHPLRGVAGSDRPKGREVPHGCLLSERDSALTGPRGVPTWGKRCCPKNRTRLADAIQYYPDVDEDPRGTRWGKRCESERGARPSRPRPSQFQVRSSIMSTAPAHRVRDLVRPVIHARRSARRRGPGTV